jgi:hypothetical protein
MSEDGGTETETYRNQPQTWARCWRVRRRDRAAKLAPTSSRAPRSLLAPAALAPGSTCVDLLLTLLTAIWIRCKSVGICNVM